MNASENIGEIKIKHIDAEMVRTGIGSWEPDNLDGHSVYSLGATPTVAPDAVVRVDDGRGEAWYFRAVELLEALKGLPDEEDLAGYGSEDLSPGAYLSTVWEALEPLRVPEPDYPVE